MNVITKYSGDLQTQGIASILALPFVARITNPLSNDNPVSGVTVNFAITSYPDGSSGQSLSASSAVTDSDGQAQVFLTLGSKAGVYEITASSSGLVSVVFSIVGGAIVDLARFKRYLGDTNVENDLLYTEIIGNISQEIEDALMQPVAPRVMTDILNGTGDSKQYLDSGRIISLYEVGGSILTSVQTRTLITDSWVNLSDSEDGYYLDPTEAWAVELLDFGRFPLGRRNVKIVYNCGFAPIPGDITKMCLEMCQTMWQESQKSGVGRLGVDSVNRSSGGVGGSDRFIDLNDGRWKRIIQKYKRYV
jgi:hypothetical protein